MNGEQLRLDDAPALGSALPRARSRRLALGEVWWTPGQRFYHVEAEPLRFDHLFSTAAFGTVAEAIAAGALEPCRRCARLLA